MLIYFASLRSPVSSLKMELQFPPTYITGCLLFPQHFVEETAKASRRFFFIYRALPGIEEDRGVPRTGDKRRGHQKRRLNTRKISFGRILFIQFSVKCNNGMLYVYICMWTWIRRRERVTERNKERKTQDTSELHMKFANSKNVRLL